MNKIAHLKAKKIGIVRALQLGDLLCAIPAVRAIKAGCPEAELTLIGLPWAKEFVRRFSTYFSDFIEFPGFPGLPERPFDTDRMVNFLQNIKSQNLDLIVQMHGNGGLVNPASAMMGSKRLAGYYKPGNYLPDEELFMPYPEEGSEIRRHLKLAEFLGFSTENESLEFPIFQDEEEKYKTIFSQLGLAPGSYVCVHAGARDTKRWWGAKNFAEVADQIAAKGYTIVLTGTEAERPAVDQVASLMKSPAINLTGKTGLGVLAAVVRDAAMLLSNDTGVSHIAAAVKTPSVIIFLTSDPNRWAPLNQDLHQIILPEQAKNIDFVLFNTEQALIDRNKKLFNLKKVV